MSDSNSQKEPREGSEININEETEVRYWTQKLDCSRERLFKAVDTVGSSVEKVKEFLRSTL